MLKAILQAVVLSDGELGILSEVPIEQLEQSGRLDGIGDEGDSRSGPAGVEKSGSKSGAAGLVI